MPVIHCLILKIDSIETILQNSDKFIKLTLMIDLSENDRYKNVDKAAVKQAYGGLVTMVTEAAKNDMEIESLRCILLNELNYMIYNLLKVSGLQKVLDLIFRLCNEFLKKALGDQAFSKTFKKKFLMTTFENNF